MDCLRDPVVGGPTRFVERGCEIGKTGFVRQRRLCRLQQVDREDIEVARTSEDIDKRP